MFQLTIMTTTAHFISYYYI